ncbi:Fic family protein [Leptospira levettii]|uniref:Fic family protein n=1 Tax=Leptospira levettii TaxID=2023178 RepID=UPI001083873E|nr:Fic/DOC family N-terminal domain-containing protein [Leptospira levettii]TGM92722.1 Fic family protein [Leptospira levettii]
MDLISLKSIPIETFETPAVLKKLATASRKLAELKGVAASIPNQNILINTLGLQEAKDSSAIENIITTHDEIFKEESLTLGLSNASAKEVLNYRQALKVGFDLVKKNQLLTINTILQIHSNLELNLAGFRKQAGTTLKDRLGNIIYTPPQDPKEIETQMVTLETLINDDTSLMIDPLIKMTLIHHHFESIHPFYDGNGRTGRIINVLYLVKQGLLDNLLLYLSRHIVRTKSEYYRLLQEVRDKQIWEEWILYLLEAVEKTAGETILTIQEIKKAFLDYKHRIRADFKFYSQDLINNLFSHPYTKIEFLENDLQVSRLTATKYLDALAEAKFLKKEKIGRSNYYINVALYQILTGTEK